MSDGMDGRHVRLEAAFVKSTRIKRLSDAAQALYVYLQALALEYRREFLPLEETADEIAHDRRRTPEQTVKALRELTASRELVGALADGRIRVIGVRKKHGKQFRWQDEWDEATAWNTEHPARLIDPEAFREVVVKGRPANDQPAPKKRPKRKPKGPAPAARTSPNEPETNPERTGNEPPTEEKRREEGEAARPTRAKQPSPSSPAFAANAPAQPDGHNDHNNGNDPADGNDDGNDHGHDTVNGIAPVPGDEDCGAWVGVPATARKLAEELLGEFAGDDAELALARADLLAMLKSGGEAVHALGIAMDLAAGIPELSTPEALAAGITVGAPPVAMLRRRLAMPPGDKGAAASARITQLVLQELNGAYGLRVPEGGPTRQMDFAKELARHAGPPFGDEAMKPKKAKKRGKKKRSS